MEDLNKIMEIYTKEKSMMASLLVKVNYIEEIIYYLKGFLKIIDLWKDLEELSLLMVAII